MGVIDEFVRQKRVQHHFDRRIGRGGVDQIGAFDGDEIFVGDSIERTQLAKRRKPHGRQPGGSMSPCRRQTP